MKQTKDKTSKFAEGMCFKKLFIVYIIGSVFGNYYEMIMNLIKHYLKNKTIFWEARRGVIYGPFSPIYGFGAVLMTYLLADKKHKWYQTLLYGALLGGIAEYMIGFLQETFVGTISWDYSNRLLNINGRTTIPIMLIWGFICLIYIKLVYPFINKLIEEIPIHIGTICFNVILVLLSFDMLVSWTALIRQNLRKNNYPPVTAVGKFYDKVYPDERLEKAFPNMRIQKKEE